MNPQRCLSNASGFAMLLLTFVASVVIAMMIFMSNQVYQGSAQQRSSVREQLASLDLMKEIGVMIRRSYDIRRARGSLGCPATSKMIELRSPGGDQEICVPREDLSCFNHPLDPTPHDASSTRPRICLDSDASSSTSDVEIAFSPDKRIGAEKWAQIYQEWNVDGTRIERLLESLERQFDVLPRAYAQTAESHVPWHPTLADLGTATYRVNGSTPAPPAMPRPQRYTCSDTVPANHIRLLCVSYSVCLRYEGCNSGEKIKGRFSQTVGLDPEGF